MRQSRRSFAQVDVNLQSRSCDGLAQPHAVKLRGLRSETRLDIAQTLAIRHLRERHDAKLFAATKAADANITAMTCDNPLETRPWHEVHDLRKQRPAKVHGGAPRSGKSGKLLQNHRGEFKSTPSQIAINILALEAYSSCAVRLAGQ
jgi:hypothetical protein